jgi:uncharacterized protein DUF4252
VKTLLLAALAAMLTPIWGQQVDLKLDAVAAKAKEKTEIDLDNNALSALMKLGGKNELPANVTGVTVRNYEFAKEGEYTDRDLEAVRKQVSGANGWSRIVNIKEAKETTEIYMFSAGGKPAGFLLISAEPEELTLVNVQGAIQVAQLQELVHSSIAFDMKRFQAGGRGQ